MYTADGRNYFHIGLLSIHCIERALDKVKGLKIENALDLPCGYGRVLRFLVKRFPNAMFTACDLDRDAVDFCASTFGALAAYSSTEFDSLSLGRRFELIWVGSLVTHLDATNIRALLEMLMRHLSPGGVLILTTHGAFVVENLINGTCDKGMGRGEIPRMAAEYQRCGFAYGNYGEAFGPYGISLTSPEWIRQQVDQIGTVREVHFEASSWTGHDVFAFARDS